MLKVQGFLLKTLEFVLWPVLGGGHLRPGASLAVVQVMHLPESRLEAGRAVMSWRSCLRAGGAAV